MAIRLMEDELHFNQ